jgi:ribonuclease E
VATNKKDHQPNELMIVNDAPDEECRIAITEDGHLEELFTERTAHATNVGNIYKGRVTNVEPAIQAAFIDYGEGVNGFLHVSDLHPRYFPGSGRTERVGKKIPRRERPLMQQALKRGDEVLVQVLKEGIGTKGPTLTSYLSIPGRLLVAMPDMDRVGVSRKIEDEEKRRKMRQILDTLDLPDGFGFILRTAGFDRTKAELKRDVAYLMRLWKTMDRRMKSSKGPCELYTESDLLVRTIRDVLRPSIKSIVVDSESAYNRARSFLSIAAPRSAPKVVRYFRSAPIFHAFDIERQIDLIHCREVPLVSGGQLVIEQTEALVAIDVNSGKSRAARDSETNAYNTNCEAVDEICRQLRLRDLGGLIINDLIDMRSHKNRRAIEERFQYNLKRDRARSTMLRISEFGLVELTRQRMRPSLRKSHFIACSHCNGHGEIKSPESVGADAVRQIGYLFQFDRVRRVELVCSPRVASVLLSGKRRELVRMEDSSGKRVDVRVSDAIAADRVDFYAYDDRNADIDIENLTPPQPPTLKELETEAKQAEKKVAGARKTESAKPKSERAEVPTDVDGPAEDDEEAGKSETDASEEVAAEATTADGQVKKKRRRSRRGGRRRRKRAADAPATSESAAEHSSQPASQQPTEATSSDGAVVRKGKKRKSSKKKAAAAAAAPEVESAPAEARPDDGQPAGDDRPALRIHEIARELQVTSREVLDVCRKCCNVEVKNHMSSVPADIADNIRDHFAADADTQESAGGETTPMRKSTGKKKRPPRRRGRKKAVSQSTSSSAATEDEVNADADADAVEHDSSAKSASVSESKPDGQADESGAGKGRSRRRRRGKRSGRNVAMSDHESSPSSGESGRSAKKSSASSEPSDTAESARADDGNTATDKPRRRLYRNRSRVSPTAREEAERVLD